MHFVGGMGGMCRRVLQEAPYFVTFKRSTTNLTAVFRIMDVLANI
jgi:hypothetical protein